MIVRRGPAAVLSITVVLAALVVAPPATAVEGGPAKGDHVSRRSSAVKDTAACTDGSKSRLKVASDDDGVLMASGIVWTPGTDRWNWRFLHNSDLSARGEVKAHPGKGQAFQVTRSMVNLVGPDHFVFRAKSRADDEVCRVDVFY